MQLLQQVARAFVIEQHPVLEVCLGQLRLGQVRLQTERLGQRVCRGRAPGLRAVDVMEVDQGMRPAKLCPGERELRIDPHGFREGMRRSV